MFRHAGQEWRKRLYKLLGDQHGSHLECPETPGLQCSSTEVRPERDLLQEWRKQRLHGPRAPAGSAPQPVHSVAFSGHASKSSTTSSELRCRLRELLQAERDDTQSSATADRPSHPMVVPLQDGSARPEATESGTPWHSELCRSRLQPSELLHQGGDAAVTAALQISIPADFGQCRTSSNDGIGVENSTCMDCMKGSAQSTDEEDMEAGSAPPPAAFCAGVSVAVGERPNTSHTPSRATREPEAEVSVVWLCTVNAASRDICCDNLTWPVAGPGVSDAAPLQCKACTDNHHLLMIYAGVIPDSVLFKDRLRLMSASEASQNASRDDAAMQAHALPSDKAGVCDRLPAQPLPTRTSSPLAAHRTDSPATGRTGPQSAGTHPGGVSPNVSRSAACTATGSVTCSQASLRSDQGLAEAVDSILGGMFQSHSSSPASSTRSLIDGSCDSPERQDYQSRGSVAGDSDHGNHAQCLSNSGRTTPKPANSVADVELCAPEQHRGVPVCFVQWFRNVGAVHCPNCIGRTPDDAADTPTVPDGRHVHACKRTAHPHSA